MNITWHGLNAVKLQGKDVTIIIDPNEKMARNKADLVLASSEDIDTKGISGDPFIINTPGEYEVKGAFVYGLPWRFESKKGSGTLFRVQFEDIAIGHLGAIDRTIPNEQLGILEGIDILLIPVGDPETLDSKTAVEIISRIEPRIVVPINMSAKGFKEKLEGPEKFLKELGGAHETDEKLKVTKSDLPEEDRKVIVLDLA